MTTGIGSLPHTNAADAVELSLKALDIPFWPQLPAISFLEQMIPQYSEGMPSVRMDLQAETIWYERNEEEIERFYETAGDEDSRVAISDDYAKGFYAFTDAIKGRKFKLNKGHITGPLTYTLGLKDKDGKPLYYDEELREIAVRHGIYRNQIISYCANVTDKSAHICCYYPNQSDSDQNSNRKY